MRLSILILTHNRPALFKRCLESVLSQIIPGVEVLVNNDSSDIKEIAHPQVQYFYHKPNSLCEIYQGLLKLACGDYVYYLEDDDYLVGDFLEQKLSGDMVVGNYCPKYETVDMMGMMTMYKDEWLTPDDFLDRLSLNEEHLQLSQHIFKRSHIHDFDFPKDSHIHNDVKLVVHAALRARSIKTTKKIFYFQTVDGGDNISFPKAQYA